MMKQKIFLCIALILISSVDVTSARSRKKKARKTPRVETYYEEIDNFDFLYTDDYNPNVSFANVNDILEQATSHLGAATVWAARVPTPSTAQDSPAMSMHRTI